MINKLKQAVKLANEVSKKQKDFHKCIANGVCPNCASKDLIHYTNNEGLVSGNDYECPSCNWKWSDLVED